jgi:hypothetical protein
MNIVMTDKTEKAKSARDPFRVSARISVPSALDFSFIQDVE